MKFYTYIYRDPSRNNESIYVGKGQKLRAYSHLKLKGIGPFISRLKYMNKNNIVPSIEIINALDESHSFLMEECLIEVIGRKDLGKGPLLNLTDGGEGASGRIWTDDQKAAYSANRSGEKNPMFGTKRSNDTKLKIGASQPKKRNYTTEARISKGDKQRGDKNSMYGKLPPNTIPIVYNGVKYESIKAAAKAHNVLYQTFFNRYKKEII